MGQCHPIRVQPRRTVGAVAWGRFIQYGERLADVRVQPTRREPAIRSRACRRWRRHQLDRLAKDPADSHTGDIADWEPVAI